MQHCLKIQQLLDLLQITNSNFPIGSFSHSYGLETYIRDNLCSNVNELEKNINQFVWNYFIYTDLLAIKKVFELYKNKQIDQIFKIDQMLSTNGMSKECREATKKVGVQMLKLYLELFPNNEILNKYNLKINNKICTGHPAISFSLLCLSLDIDYNTCIYTHLYSSISTLIQNCIRAIPLGQIEGQKLIYKLKNQFLDISKYINNLDFEKNFCKSAPGLEIKQMEHEYIHVRLFMS